MRVVAVPSEVSLSRMGPRSCRVKDGLEEAELAAAVWSRALDGPSILGPPEGSGIHAVHRVRSRCASDIIEQKTCDASEVS